MECHTHSRPIFLSFVFLEGGNNTGDMASLPGCVSNITENLSYPSPTFSVKCLHQLYTLYIRRTGMKSVPSFSTLPHKMPQTDFPKFSPTLFFKSHFPENLPANIFLLSWNFHKNKNTICIVHKIALIFVRN